jgi:hypothetical protein
MIVYCQHGAISLKLSIQKIEPHYCHDAVTFPVTDLYHQFICRLMLQTGLLDDCGVKQPPATERYYAAVRSLKDYR